MGEGGAAAGQGQKGPPTKGQGPDAGVREKGQLAGVPPEEERGELEVTDDGAPKGGTANAPSANNPGKARGTIILHRGGLKKGEGGGEKPATGATEGGSSQPPPKPEGDTGPKEK